MKEKNCKSAGQLTWLMFLVFHMHSISHSAAASAWLGDGLIESFIHAAFVCRNCDELLTDAIISTIMLAWSQSSLSALLPNPPEQSEKGPDLGRVA